VRQPWMASQVDGCKSELGQHLSLSNREVIGMGMLDLRRSRARTRDD
jgi:hypothetical protein